MLKRFILATLAAAVVAPVLTAQMRGRGGVARPLPGFGHRVNFPARNHSPGSRGFYLGDTAFFYSDYPFQQFAAEAEPPALGVMRSPAAEAVQEKRAEPLLIELRGDRYVRFGGVERSPERGAAAAPDYAAGLTTKSSAFARTEARSTLNPQAIAAAPAAELPPAVLVYRDGHREEVSDYAIVGAVMYARGDYWRNGYWTKNIQLSSLNISATLKTNQDNGVRFALPSAPNEVVTRP
jgi:hypothetical protein